MIRTVIQGADRAPRLPSCVRCEGSIVGSARLVGRRLAHPSCVDRPALELVAAACSVCEVGGFDPGELDSSGRCDSCRP